MQFGNTSVDRAARNACNPGDRGHTSTAGRQRLGRRKPPPPAFIQKWIKGSKPQAYGAIVDHNVNLATTIPKGNPPYHPKTAQRFNYLSTDP